MPCASSHSAATAGGELAPLNRGVALPSLGPGGPPDPPLAGSAVADAAESAALVLAEEEEEEYEESYAIFSSENWAWPSWLPRLQLEVVRRPARADGLVSARRSARGRGASDTTGAVRQGAATSDTVPHSAFGAVSPGRPAASPVARRAADLLHGPRGTPSGPGVGNGTGAGRSTEPGDVVHARDMAQLRDVFPHMTEGALRRALLRRGSLEQAVEALLMM